MIYVSQHSDIRKDLDRKTAGVNGGLEAFTNELKAQGVWDDVTIVMVSEFARTMAGNTGQGRYVMNYCVLCLNLYFCHNIENDIHLLSINHIFSDHAWGGNYFIAGGEIDGKRIIGTYPETFSFDSPNAFEPGIFIPTLPWDSVWNGIAQWFGISDSMVSKASLIFSFSVYYSF